MSFFKTRSDYFKGLANANKLIAHNREENGETRQSFFRMNDEDELMAACVNFIHFPCLVHFGFDGRYTGDQNAVPKAKISNQVLILKKVDVASMDSIEDAYDVCFEVMEQIVSKMYNEWLTDSRCSPFGNLDLSRFSFQAYSVTGNLFGYLLTFEDDQWAKKIYEFDATKWYL